MDTKVAKPATRRMRRRHAAEFKAQVIESCLQPGIPFIHRVGYFFPLTGVSTLEFPHLQPAMAGFTNYLTVCHY